jgi:hypothetical protein
MAKHVTCPQCGYYQPITRECCECTASLWSEPDLARLLTAIEAL